MNYKQRLVTFYREQGSRPSPQKRNAKKAKWLSGEALQIAVKKGKRKAKEKGMPFPSPVPLIAAVNSFHTI